MLAEEAEGLVVLFTRFIVDFYFCLESNMLFHQDFILDRSEGKKRAKSDKRMRTAPHHNHIHIVFCRFVRESSRRVM